MSWNEWEKTYPAPEVKEVKPSASGPYDTRSEAEGVKDTQELTTNTVYIVVRCNGKYYVE